MMTYLPGVVSSNKDLVLAFLEDLDKLHETLYIDHACGGPLHIVLDDGNLDDGSLLFCYRFLKMNPQRSDALTKIICNQILDYLMVMTEPQRLVWLSHAQNLKDLIIKVENGKVITDDNCNSSIQLYDKENGEWVNFWKDRP